MHFFCLLFLMTCLLLWRPGNGSCSANKKNDSLSFIGTPAGVSYSRKGHYKAIECCATGYTHFTWYKNFTSGDIKNFPWYVEDDVIALENDNQTLTFYTTRIEKDYGIYICEGRNTTDVIQHNVLLNVFECEDLNGEIDIVEKPEDIMRVKIGASQQLKCEGNFGCLNKGAIHDRIAQWEYTDGENNYKTPRNSSKFSVYNYAKSNGTVIGSSLIINRIDDNDYSTTYICFLQTPGNKKQFNITFKPPETELSDYIYMLLVIPAIFVIFIIFGIFYYFYRPQIHYFCNRKRGRLPDRGEKENDILVVYNDEDKTFVQKSLLPNLKEYNIFEKNNVPLGARELSMLTDATFKSYSIILVYSLKLLKDIEACYIFDIIKSTAHRGVIVIQLEHISKETIKELQHDDIILINAPTILTTVKWPWSDQENKRKLHNFYCSLKNKLACVVKTTDSVKKPIEALDSVGSSRPLLTSTSSDMDESMRNQSVRETRKWFDSVGNSRPLLTSTSSDMDESMRNQSERETSKGFDSVESSRPLLTSTSSDRDESMRNPSEREIDQKYCSINNNTDSYTTEDIVEERSNQADTKHGIEISGMKHQPIKQLSSDSGYNSVPDSTSTIVHIHSVH